MNQIVNITIQGQQPSTDGETGSLKLAQELPKQEQATVFDVATIIDQMHGVVDPCLNTRTEQSYQPEPAQGVSLVDHQQQYLQQKYSTTSAFEALAGDLGGSCLAKQGKPITLEVYAFWSNEDIADDYKLICPVGRIDNQRRVQTRMRLKISVSGSSSVDFGYYVKERPSFSDFYELFWIGGNVVDIYGKKKSIADPQWDGGTSLYWAENITSGHIFVEFDTIYDIWDCTLQGVWTGKKRDYAATVTGIWDGTPPELPLIVPEADTEETDPCSTLSNTADAVDLSVPGNEPEEPEQPVECEQTINYEVRGRCSEELLDSWTEKVAAPCDDEGRNPPDKLSLSFVAEADSGCGSECTAAGYEEICCRPPADPDCVPACLEYNSVNRGGLLPEGGMDGLKGKYGDDVQIAWVYPEEGDCGVHTDKLVIPSWSCDPCEGITALVWDAGNPSVIAPGGSIALDVTGGNPAEKPITWSLQGTGTGYTLTGGGSTYINGRTVELFAGLDVCGPITVKADDGCSNDSGSIQHTGGVEFTVSELNLLPGAYQRVDIINGVPTYDWSVIGPLAIISGGTPTSTYAYVQLLATACESGTLELTDQCNSISLPVNNIKPPVSFTASELNLLPGAWGRVYTSNGRAPYDWSVSGPLTIIGGGTPTTSYADVKLDLGSCGGGSVSVTDLCNSASIPVNNTVQPIYLTGTKTTLCTNETARCYAYDGQLPYTWSVTGGLVIIAGGLPTSTFCDVRNTGGGGDVQISDACGSDSYTFAQTPDC